MDTTGIRKELVEYITSGIVPLYAGFDPAHREDHAEAGADCWQIRTMREPR